MQHLSAVIELGNPVVSLDVNDGRELKLWINIGSYVISHVPHKCKMLILKRTERAEVRQGIPGNSL